MKKRRHTRLLVLMLGGSLMCGGCSLLPAEEEARQVMTVTAEDTTEYELAQVMRGRVALTQPVYCTYTQLREESLSFSADSGVVQYVYVSVGDNVKAGDLLAALNIEDLEEELRELSYTIARTTLLQTQTQELKNLELSQAESSYRAGERTRAEYDTSVEQIEQSYEDTLQGYEDTLYIAGLRLEKLQAQKEGSLLYAGMDGTVSYVRSSLQGSRVQTDMTAITIIDSSQCAFRTDNMDAAEYFSAGDEVRMYNSNGTEYVTTVMETEEAPDEEHVYFSLQELDFTLSVGTRATITLVLSEQEDVLYLPKTAVHRAGEQYYVYLQDDNGLKIMREVTVGLAGNSVIEITSGLSEGDIVVKR